MSEGVILVVDDEPRMAAMLELALQAAGFDVVTAPDAAAAWKTLTTQAVRLVILDVMLPGASGLELCRRVRKHSDAPVILLTALGSPSQRVAGLEMGADDYVTKPFSPRELILRVQAVLRRSSRTAKPLVSTRRVVGSLYLDAALGLAAQDGRDLHLTPSEFRLLWLLTEAAGASVPVDALLSVIGHAGDRWGGRAALRTALYRLRGKLETEGSPVRIVNEHGHGYRYVTP